MLITSDKNTQADSAVFVRVVTCQSDFLLSVFFFPIFSRVFALTG